MTRTVNFKSPESRLLINLPGNRDDPTFIVFAGVHGNETSGLIALEKVLERIKNQQITLQGSFYAIAGNLPAIQK
ncbi:MAG: succinylglutamate desuccinylase/aspartoacylase family protein, partial [Tunicatimonas sp.]